MSGQSDEDARRGAGANAAAPPGSPGHGANGISGDRRCIDGAIIALGAGALLGLILIAQGRTRDDQFIHPMHSPNDRSRWATIRALGDLDTYAIGTINEDGTYTPDSIIAQPGWDTIDKVRRPDTGLAYSSKPPLLPTLLAYAYKLAKKIPTFAYTPDAGWRATGHLTFTEHPLAVVRLLVAISNWVPYILFLILYSRLLDRWNAGAWVRVVAVLTAAGGTYLTGFSVTLNNHTIAAFFAFFAAYPALAVWMDDRQDAWRFALAGLFGSFAATLELPALSLFGVVALALLVCNPIKTLTVLVPCALIPLAAHCYTTYQVTGSMMPAYGEKDWYVYEGSYWKIDPQSGRLVGSSKDPKTGELIVGDKSGIDNQHEPWYVYLFHMTLGHHGWFSLTPVMVFAAIGLLRSLRGSGAWSPISAAVLGLTVLIVAFYIVAPMFGIGQRNYGGMCQGMRWLFWLIPLWLVFLPAGLEWKQSCAGYRCLAMISLTISAASVFYATRNPWTRPWLQELLHRSGWLPY